MPEPEPPYTYATGCVCSLCLTERLAGAQAALDRLAALTEEDVLDEIEDCYTERERARAVLALVRARVEGRDA